jgi:hypothetical protein
MTEPPTTKEHLRQRMAQRNSDPEASEITLAYGRRMYRSGAEFFFLGARDLPKGLRRTHSQLIGTTVVVDGGEVATVYRNRRALSSIKRKRNRGWRALRTRRD